MTIPKSFRISDCTDCNLFEKDFAIIDFITLKAFIPYIKAKNLKNSKSNIG